MTGAEFVQAAAARLQASGAEVSSRQLPGGSALVGHRAEFRMRWMATRLHLFTVVTAVPRVTAATMRQFSTDALDHAAAAKGALRGFQTGVAAIPVLVGDVVDPDAAEFARHELVRRFSAFAWPAAVDLSAGVAYSHEGRVLVGGLYAGWMREQTDLVLGRV